MNLRSHHIISLLMIALAIAMTACQGKSGFQSAPSSAAPQSLEIDKGKLTPIQTEQLPPAKELLKQLGSTAHLEKHFLGEAAVTESTLSLLPTDDKALATDLQSRCTFNKSKVEPKIEPDKVRVGAQFDFSRHFQSQGEACPVEMLRHMEANLTYWSVDKNNQSGTVRTRAEVQYKTRYSSSEQQKLAGFRALDFRFRIVEDGRLGERLKAHLRVFGGGYMELVPGGRVELRARGEQVRESGKTSMILRLRTKTPKNETFNYAIQLEELNGKIKIVKTYIGNVLLTEEETRDLQVARFAERFILSVQ